jgi:hypothetical protein
LSREAPTPGPASRKRSGGKTTAVAALEAALKAQLDCPPQLSKSLASKASKRLDDLVASGHASDLSEAAERLVGAWKALSTDNAWKLLDVNPLATRSKPGRQLSDLALQILSQEVAQ